MGRAAPRDRTTRRGGGRASLAEVQSPVQRPVRPVRGAQRPETGPVRRARTLGARTKRRAGPAGGGRRGGLGERGRVSGGPSPPMYTEAQCAGVGSPPRVARETGRALRGQSEATRVFGRRTYSIMLLVARRGGHFIYSFLAPRSGGWAGGAEGRISIVFRARGGQTLMMQADARNVPLQTARPSPDKRGGDPHDAVSSCTHVARGGNARRV